MRALRDEIRALRGPPHLVLLGVEAPRPETKVKLNPVRRRHIFSILVGEVANIKDPLDQAAELSAPHAVASVMGMKIPRPRKTRQLKLKEADPPVEDYPA